MGVWCHRMACVLLALSPLAAASAATDEQDLALAFGDSATISVATGASQSLRRAPAVASVFTAADIRALGATDLSQVLELVPGLHVSRSFFFYDPLYQMRGVQSSFNQQMLILIDGVRRQAADTGAPEEVWVDMPLDNVARIEVIRGPGSALYGADAFSGVISITSKTAAEQRGARIGTRLGSHRERALSLQHGGRSGELSWAGHARLGRTRGSNETIEADAQTALDAAFGSQASLAPGPLDRRSRAIDAGLHLGWRDWQLRASFKKRSDIGVAAGLAQALGDRSSSINVQRASVSLVYQRTELLPGWDLQLQAALDRDAVSSLLVLFPPGAFGGAYPEGMIGGPGRATRYGALGAVASYRGWRGHQLRLGIGSNLTDMYRTDEVKNFNFTLIPGVGLFPVPLGSLVDVTAEGIYMTPRRRHLHYLLLQDEWQIAKDWTLTAGLRHDRYSDFGGTTNPRLALVWDAAYNLTLKLMHGRAFRAQRFQQSTAKCNRPWHVAIKSHVGWQNVSEL